MKLNKILLSSILISTLVLPSTVFAEEKAVPEVQDEPIEWEVSGVLKNESGFYLKDTKNYTRNSANKANVLGQEHEAGDIMKFENSLNLFINAQLMENVNFHMQTNFIYDAKAPDGYDKHRINTQNDYLREFYIDTAISDWDLRIGKQQVVWGTADGVKFLDIINPTDFREWGQNTMEDSRIPLWMMVAETAIGEGDASLQLLWVPDLELNQIPGLNNPNTGDTFQPFVSLGVDSITGDYNGFLNIGEDFGKVATTFSNTFQALLPTFAGLFGNNILSGFGGVTVSQWAAMDGTAVENFFLAGAGASGYIGGSVGGASGNQILAQAVQNSGATTNIFNSSTGLTTSTPTSILDYMGDTTFATFNDFKDMSTQYRKKHVPERLRNHNLGMRFKDSTDEGTNYSFNYYYHWDNNPTVDMHWEDGSGNKLETKLTPASFDNTTGAPVALGAANSYTTNTVTLTGKATATPAVLVFEENMHRVHSIGGSFDTTIDTDFAPFVLRGEFVYDRGTKQVVMDKGLLALGDLTGALKSEDADMIKFVVGLDVTVMTNLFVSLQYMQLTNLDYVEQNVQYAGNSQSYQKYTANPATMHITNGFAAAEEHQTGFTLFLSKPFLENDALRVNNIILYENEEKGIWNRFDLEYSWSDDIILTAEIDYYGGSDNAVFGQFVEQSNAQLGVKYIF